MKFPIRSQQKLHETKATSLPWWANHIGANPDLSKTRLVPSTATVPTATVIMDLVPNKEFDSRWFSEGTSIPCKYFVKNLGPTDIRDLTVWFSCFPHQPMHDKSSERTVVSSALRKVIPEKVSYLKSGLWATRDAETGKLSAADTNSHFVYYAARMTYEDGNGPREVTVCKIFLWPPVGWPGSPTPSIRMNSDCIDDNTVK